MKRVFSSPDLSTVNRLKDILEQEGIGCFVRNEVSSGLAPEIPMTESTPELWINDDHDLAKAQQIKSDWDSPLVVAGSPWKCPSCGEQLEPQFTSCWNCGAARS